MAIDFDEALGEMDADVLSGMNITPLIDVLLVLLVMIIITIPIQLHAVSMDLPVGLPPPDAPEPQVVRLEVSRSNQLRWNGELLPGRADLDLRLQAAAQLVPQPEIHVRAEPKTKYDTVAAVLTAAQRLGLVKIGVVGLEEFGS